MIEGFIMNEKTEQIFRDWLSACPIAEFVEIDCEYGTSDDDVVVVSVSFAIEQQ
jgi:hypothetical protein